MITIIIPTLSNIELNNLLKRLSKLNFPLIIIDNQPTQEKQLMIKKIIKNNLIYLPQKKNLGFAKAINFGLKYAQTDWLLILNDDILFPSKTNLKQIFNQLINFANKNRLVAITPILVNKKGEVENMGYRVLPYGKVQLIKKEDEIDSDLCRDDKKTNKNDNNQIDGLTAACLFIKKDVFEEVGGFDERFFAYLEDVDLFLTLKEKDYRFGVYRQFSVVHNQMTTGKTLSWRKNWHDFKNWIFIIFKHPKYFHFNLKLFIERLKNFWGIVKTIPL